MIARLSFWDRLFYLLRAFDATPAYGPRIQAYLTQWISRSARTGGLPSRERAAELFTMIATSHLPGATKQQLADVIAARTR